MDRIIARNVNDLHPSDRQSIESLVGRTLESNQQVFIMVLTPQAAPEESVRRQAAAGIRQIIAEAQANADDISAANADAASAEAMASVRHRDQS